MPLTSTTLSLTPFSPVDVPLLERLLNSWEALALYRPEAVLWTPDDIAHRFDDMRTFIIWSPEEEQALGMARIGEYTPLHRTAELGVFLDEPHRGVGLGIKAGVLLLHYGFCHLALAKVLFRVFGNNTHSQQVVESLGFVLEGVLREQVFRAGARQDVRLYGLLADEYHASERLSRIREALLPAAELFRYQNCKKQE